MIQKRIEAMVNLDIDIDNIEESFYRIASELMNDWMLICGEGKYRIAELEFYFRNISHQDHYVHAHTIQKTKGKWYFHASGIDITFGDQNSHGGILIRALQDLEDESNYVYGPLKSKTELFSRVPDIYSTSIAFRLDKIDVAIDKERPIACQRIGLNPHRDQYMYDKPYRYIVLPKKKHPGKGKVKRQMAGSNEYSKEEIKKIWG